MDVFQGANTPLIKCFFFFLERPATYTQEWQKCLFINIANVLLQLAYHWAQKVLTQSSLDHSYKY